MIEINDKNYTLSRMHSLMSNGDMAKGKLIFEWNMILD